MNRVTVTFSIWSEKIRPEKISEILNFEPDRIVFRGIDRVPSRPRPTAFGWHVTSVENDQILAGNVLSRLIFRIKPVVDRINELKKIDQAISVNFFLHIAPKAADVSLFIDRTSVEIICLMGGDLDIEFFDL